MPTAVRSLAESRSGLTGLAAQERAETDVSQAGIFSLEMGLAAVKVRIRVRLRRLSILCFMIRIV